MLRLIEAILIRALAKRPGQVPVVITQRFSSHDGSLHPATGGGSLWSALVGARWRVPDLRCDWVRLAPPADWGSSARCG